MNELSLLSNTAPLELTRLEKYVIEFICRFPKVSDSIKDFYGSSE